MLHPYRNIVTSELLKQVKKIPDYSKSSPLIISEKFAMSLDIKDTVSVDQQNSSYLAPPAPTTKIHSSNKTAVWLSDGVIGT